jgi:hypothetical protein
LQTTSLRYSRLQVCATPLKANRLRSQAHNNNKYVLGLGLTFVCGLLLGGAAVGFVQHRKPFAEQSAASVGSPERNAELPAKPWGQLDTLEFPFGDPGALAPDREVRLRKTEWYFEGISQGQLETFLNSCGLDEQQKAELMRGSQWQVSSNGFLVQPPDDLVAGLSPVARANIYELLARSQVNYAQRFPFRFSPEEIQTRFGFTRLSEEKIRLIESLSYTNNGDLCFADLQLLPKRLTSSEFDEAMNALYRIPTYRLRLRIFEDSNIDQLVAYWGKGGREGRIRPLLDSLKKVAGTNGASANISYLLPDFARLRLYTFPTNWPEKQIAREDCFWTSMNFFNREPDNRFLDADAAVHALTTECAPVTGEKEFGDLIAITDGKGKGIHMCVHIADDFVFTKNGRNVLSPWVIMKREDMLALFPAEGRRVLSYRKPAVGSRVSKVEGR